jgi:hypothetical protein
MACLAQSATEGMASEEVDQLPTLTEVVEWSGTEGRRLPALAGASRVSWALLQSLQGPQDPQGPQRPQDPQPKALEQQVTELSANLLFELESKVSLALESRLQEALAPVLARAAQAMAQEAKKELAALMQELVEEAVTQAIERHTSL